MKEINSIEEFEEALKKRELVNKIINLGIGLPYMTKELYDVGFRNRSISFEKCIFNEPVRINNFKNNDNDGLTFELSITFIACEFKDVLDAQNSYIDAKVRFRQCKFKSEVYFINTTITKLADFWQSKFFKPSTFYKTDFLSTAVFSSVTFHENILFTYTLFDGKTIFGRTNFNKGLDISQSIIAGELKLFDLNFNFKKYISRYVSLDNDLFQDLIENKHEIPLINKVGTFQILKNQFAKQGNHIDEITMRQQEKKAFSELIKAREKDENWHKSTSGDKFILWLNRWSNNYRSDFRNGISFTAITAIIFLLLTLVTTGEFWHRLNLSADFDYNIIGYTIKQFISFLNPVHSTEYIDNLKPFFGIPYIFDFLGRIAVGYGIYQTIQAFRKFR